MLPMPFRAQVKKACALNSRHSTKGFNVFPVLVSCFLSMPPLLKKRMREVSLCHYILELNKLLLILTGVYMYLFVLSLRQTFNLDFFFLQNCSNFQEVDIEFGNLDYSFTRMLDACNTFGCVRGHFQRGFCRSEDLH